MIGAAIGRLLWRSIGDQSARKVQEVADTLALAARDLAADKEADR
jgi:hypothetical protein